MSKSFLSKFIFGLIIVAVAVLWLLSEMVPATFGFFNLSWAIAIVSAGFGVIVLWKGVFSKNLVTIKWFNIVFGSVLLVIAVFSIYSAIALPEDYLRPIIAIIAAVAILLGIVATGGKKWDQGDNKKVGYKNYNQRKEEEKKEQEKLGK